MEPLAIILGAIVLSILVWFAIGACSDYLAARAIRRQQKKAKQHEAHIIVLVDWLEQLSAEQRIEHLHTRAQRRKRERREVVH